MWTSVWRKKVKMMPKWMEPWTKDVLQKRDQPVFSPHRYISQVTSSPLVLLIASPSSISMKMVLEKEINQVLGYGQECVQAISHQLDGRFLENSWVEHVRDGEVIRWDKEKS